MKSETRFGPTYDRRYYGNARTAVTSRREMARRGEFIASFASYLDLPVRSILDAGCGVGGCVRRCDVGYHAPGTSGWK